MNVKKILISVAAVLGVLILGFVTVVAMRPNVFSVSRSATMKAPPERVFEQVNDLHKWNDWSPWAKLDPNAKNTFEGPAAGEGAVFRWAGNAEVGEGVMTIIESQPHQRVRMKLVFIKPMEDTSETEFAFKPDGDRTMVIWTMSGAYKDFMSKAICMCMNMDAMMGKQFDEGLANIKAIVEAPSSSTDPAEAVKSESVPTEGPAATEPQTKTEG